MRIDNAENGVFTCFDTDSLPRKYGIFVLAGQIITTVKNSPALCGDCRMEGRVADVHSVYRFRRIGNAERSYNGEQKHERKNPGGNE